MPRRKKDNYEVVSYSLPRGLLEDIGTVSKRLKVSRSALVNEILADTITPLKGLLDQVVDNPDQEQVRRFRGASEVYIKDAFREVMELLKEVGPHG